MSITGRGRGGRGSFAAGFSSPGRGHTRSSGRIRPPTINDATPEELAEMDEATDDDALVRRVAGWISARNQTRQHTPTSPPGAETPRSPLATNRLPPPRAPSPAGSDDATVAADNSEGNLVHRFVNQPTTTVATTTSPAPTTVSVPGERSAGSRPSASSSSAPSNPYTALSLVPAHPFERRYVELRSVLVQFFTKLRECDSSLVLHPWEDKENTTRQSGTRPWKSISSPSQLPLTLTGLKKYFPRILPKTGGGHVYPSCYLGHTKTFDFIKDKLTWWFQQERHGLWERQLQCESTYIVGWGLYSTQSMHVPELRRVLSELLGFDIGIRWRTIQLDKSGPIPAEQLAKALHFEVNRTNRRQAKQRLGQIYARDATSFPLGIKLRLMGPLSDLMNFHTRTKVSALRLRQLQFCNHMRGMRTWELHTIDQPDETTGLTLRKRLTDIRSQKDGFQLFHSVDPSYIGDAVQFTFHPNREEEARAMITGLIPYLRWKMADEQSFASAVERERFFSRALYRHFSRDALDRAVDAVWNPQTMSVDSPADDYNGWIHDVGDSELDCSHMDPSPAPGDTIPTASTGPRVRPHDAAGDQDSISTLPQGQSVASFPSQASATSLPSAQPPPNASPATTTPSSLTSATTPAQLLSSIDAMISSLRLALEHLPNTPETNVVRQQLASLPSGSSAQPSSSSLTAPPPSSSSRNAATGPTP